VSFGFIIASVCETDVSSPEQQLHEGEDQLGLLVVRDHAGGSLKKR
jgi:hypothetical protein